MKRNVWIRKRRFKVFNLKLNDIVTLPFLLNFCNIFHPEKKKKMSWKTLNWVKWAQNKQKQQKKMLQENKSISFLITQTFHINFNFFWLNRNLLVAWIGHLTLIRWSKKLLLLNLSILQQFLKLFQIFWLCYVQKQFGAELSW